MLYYCAFRCFSSPYCVVGSGIACYAWYSSLPAKVHTNYKNYPGQAMHDKPIENSLSTLKHLLPFFPSDDCLLISDQARYVKIHANACWLFIMMGCQIVHLRFSRRNDCFIRSSPYIPGFTPIFSLYSLPT